MGGCISRRSSSAVAAADTIQLVHLNGHVQHFHIPITARQVTGNSPRPAEYFISTAAQLVSVAVSPALNPDAILQPGKVYFLLPFSTLHPDVSPSDLSSIARKLTAAAKSAPRPTCVAVGGGNDWKTPAAAKSRQWKPFLDTIQEKAVNKSESDLQDKHNNNRVCIWD